jgi:hypothetical protein
MLPAAPDGAPPRRIRVGSTALAQRGPDEAPERLRALARRGKNHKMLINTSYQNYKISCFEFVNENYSYIVFQKTNA